MQQSVQSCKMSYLLHRTNLSNQILPHECVNCDKFKTWIEWNWDRWLLHGENSIKYGWFKDKTTSKLIEFTQKLLHFTKLRGLFYLNLLPQPFNIFTQIYLPYLWRFACGDGFSSLVKQPFLDWVDHIRLPFALQVKWIFNSSRAASA